MEYLPYSFFHLQKTNKKNGRFPLGLFSVCGITETWRHGHGREDMGTWRHGDMETWKHGDMDKWRHGAIKWKTEARAMFP